MIIRPLLECAVSLPGHRAGSNLSAGSVPVPVALTLHHSGGGLGCRHAEAVHPGGQLERRGRTHEVVPLHRCAVAGTHTASLRCANECCTAVCTAGFATSAGAASVLHRCTAAQWHRYFVAAQLRRPAAACICGMCPWLAPLQVSATTIAMLARVNTSLRSCCGWTQTTRVRQPRIPPHPTPSHRIAPPTQFTLPIILHPITGIHCIL